MTTRQRGPLTAALTVLAAFVGLAAVPAPGRAEVPPARLVAGWDGADAEALAAIRAVADRFGGHVDLVEPVLDFAVVVVDDDQAGDVLDALVAAPEIDRAEPDGVVTVHYTPNDPAWYAQWGPPAIGVPSVWDTGLGSHGRQVGIIDTGVDTGHPDLAPNVCRSGANFVDPGQPPSDTHSHGTHVAGTVGARIDNAAGVAGMGNSCVVAIKVIDGHGRGSTATLAAGIRWAADQGVDVVNMSLGNNASVFPVPEAVQYAWSRGMLMVASAGNDDCAPVSFPAALPEVIAVAALESSRTRASYSNCGPEVELAAPGSTIASTEPGGAYGYKSGTSMASPHVAGVAALLWDRNPSLTNAQIRCLLRDTADDLGVAGKDDEYGFGRVDADGALQRMNATTPLPSWPSCTAAPNPNPPRSDDSTYIGGTDVVAQCLLSVGGACFELEEGDVTVDILIDDINVDPAAGAYQFEDATGNVLLHGAFCGAADNVVIPNGATDLTVFTGGPSRGLTECGSPARVATLGWVRLEFNRT